MSSKINNLNFVGTWPCMATINYAHHDRFFEVLCIDKYVSHFVEHMLGSKEQDKKAQKEKLIFIYITVTCVPVCDFNGYFLIMMY